MVKRCASDKGHRSTEKKEDGEVEKITELGQCALRSSDILIILNIDERIRRSGCLKVYFYTGVEGLTHGLFPTGSTVQNRFCTNID